MCSTYNSETKAHTVTVTEAGTGELLANILFFPESRSLIRALTPKKLFDCSKK